MSGLKFSGGLSAATFLARYWQKKPLLMRAAVGTKQFELSPDEVAGLALEPDVEARLLRPGDDDDTVVLESPFALEELTSLPPRDWTLLVQDVDKHLPDLGRFTDLFDFIPSWRFDDLMISVAAPGGGVGPHVDQYDVFLCQMLGHRRWQLGAAGDHKEVATTGLRQIAPFPVSEEFLLGPGDVLYLPPGIPHDGVAEDLCTTWSVGFRAPTVAELAIGLGCRQNACDLDSARYADPDLDLSESRQGLIGERAVKRFRSLLGDAFAGNDAAFVPRLGEFLTTPKSWLAPEPREQRMASAELKKRLESGDRLCRHGMALIAQAKNDAAHWLFASGKSHLLSGQQIALAGLLCSQRQFTAADFGDLPDDALAIKLLVSLYNDGQLLFASDWEKNGDEISG